MKTLADWVEINPKTTLTKGKAYTFVGMEAITPHQRYVNTSEQRTFSGNGSKFQHLDTLFARITPCLENGKISQFIHKEKSIAFGSTEFFVFRAIPGKSTPSYVYYLTQTKEIQETAIKSMVGASGRQRADAKTIRSIPTELPEVEEQEKISAVLSNYDDLIATNQRRIALLEEAARLIYREWFVHMRFPGHDSIEKKNETPEGWTKKPLRDIAKLHYGKALKASERKPGKFPVYGSGGIIGYHNTPLVQAGSIIVGRKGNIGSLFYSEKACFPIDTVFFISPEQSSRWLYFALHSLNFISSDSAVPGLNRGYAESLPVMEPDMRTQERFKALTDPLFNEIEILQQQNHHLAQARDLLLPKLMSGQIDVSNIQLPDEDVVT